jgi:hypothetical protein
LRTARRCAELSRGGERWREAEVCRDKGLALGFGTLVGMLVSSSHALAEMRMGMIALWVTRWLASGGAAC